MNTSTLPRNASGRFVPRNPAARAPYPGEVIAREGSFSFGDWEEKPRYQRYAPPVKKGVKSLDARFVATERDLAIIRYAGRYRYVTHALIVEYTGGSSEALKTRLRKMRQNNLMRSQILYCKELGKTEVWRPTKLGHQIADTELKVIPDHDITPGTMIHTLGLAKIGGDWERTGHSTVTELEWRRDHPERKGEHVPDLLVNRGDYTLAVELELHKKESVRMYKIMHWYATKTQFKLHYIAPLPSVASAVRDEAERHKVADRLEITTARPVIPPRL